jgi:hypothetical protein
LSFATVFHELYEYLLILKVIKNYLMENLENLKNNKSKFSFSAKNKKEVDPKETENFNIEELKQYYTQFMNNYNSTILFN